jgi:hypothetical protein
MERLNETGAALGERSADWGGVAIFSGAIMTVFQPTSLVSTLLPPRLKLTEATWPSGRAKRDHPIVFIVGEMAAGGAHWGGVDFSSGLRYREMAIMIPFVRHPAHQGPTVFSCQMFADDMRPVLLGNSFYGLRKYLAEIEWEGANYQAHHQGQLVFQCTGALPDRWSRCVDNTDRGLDWLRGTFALPILGLHSSGQYVGSRFGWEFDQAQVCPVEAQISWTFERGGQAVQWKSARDYSFALREMRWRTGARRWLHSA